MNVPGLADSSGMPLGVQIVGRFGRDRAALEAAAEVTRLRLLALLAEVELTVSELMTILGRSPSI